MTRNATLEDLQEVGRLLDTHRAEVTARLQDTGLSQDQARKIWLFCAQRESRAMAGLWNIPHIADFIPVSSILEEVNQTELFDV